MKKLLILPLVTGIFSNSNNVNITNNKSFDSNQMIDYLNNNLKEFNDYLKTLIIM